MKKIILAAMASLALFGQGNAQEVSDVPLGYCAGELPKSGTYRSSEADTWVSGAIFIPASRLNTFGGNDLVGVNAGLASRLNVDEMTVWLRRDLNGENIAEKTITTETDPEILKGWNAVYFDSAWSIPENSEEGLYIGYSFHQKKTTFGLATLDVPVKNALFIQYGDEEWQDLSNEGTLCVEGLVQGDKLPKVNLALSTLSCDEVYIIDKGLIEITGTVQNLATYTITGFDVIANVDGNDVSTNHVDLEVPFGETAQFTTVMPLGIASIGNGEGSVTITLDNINEGQDEDMSDNTLSASFRIVKQDFTHRIIVEEFTTEQCPNCPRVAGYLHDGLEKEKYADRVIAICHHSAYYTDWLTSSFDNDYCWFFNAGGATYAPAIMVDRTLHADNTPVFNPTSQTDLENSWDKALKKPALVSLHITAEFDEEDPYKLHVMVDGITSMPDFAENPRISVYLIEDNIAARNQAGAANGFTHQHVNRAVNSTWGAPIEFRESDNGYEYTCDFNLSTFWEQENMQIVAFISNFNGQDPNDCEINNASNLHFSEIRGIESGINAIESSAEVEIYSISGVKMNSENLAPGIYIRKQGAKSQKFIVR